MFVDDLPYLAAVVAYGELGRHGQLGYEGKTIKIDDNIYPHALSAHAPSKIRISLNGDYNRFSCKIAINGDVPPRCAWANFYVRVDGKLCAIAHARSGEPPEPIQVSIENAVELELEVQTGLHENCHTVWLEPLLYCNDTALPSELTIVDPLERAEFSVTWPLPYAERCIATVVSPGFESMFDEMLISLKANGLPEKTLVVVFSVGCDPNKERLIEESGARVIRCSLKSKVNPGLKSILYSISRTIDAKKFICLDADMLILDDLTPLFSALDAYLPGSLLVCREGLPCWNFDHAVQSMYCGKPHDMRAITGGLSVPNGFNLIVNDGIIVSDRNALLAVDGLLRRWRGIKDWVDERVDISWRNQCVFNLALAHLGCAVELDPTYNVQLNTQSVSFCGNGNAKHEAYWQGRRARVLHFNGGGRSKALSWRAGFIQQANIALQKSLSRLDKKALSVANKEQLVSPVVSSEKYLDVFDIVNWSAGYGNLGLGGELGYEGGKVQLDGKVYEHAISAHGPSEVSFDCSNAKAFNFQCEVAIDGGVSGKQTFANFILKVDGKTVAVVKAVRPDEPPKLLCATIQRAQVLTLCVETSHTNHCHSVWLNPVIHELG